MNVLTYRPWDGVSVEMQTKRDCGEARNAFLCAEGYHKHVFRDDGLPVIEHLKKVYKILYYFGVREDSILAIALLHDSLEDNDWKLVEDLTENYSERIVAGVIRMTKDKDKKKRAIEYFHDENVYLVEYFSNIEKDPDVVLVKLSDRLHNLRNMIINLYKQRITKTINMAFTKKRLEKQLAETLRYIMPMAQRLIESDYRYRDEAIAITHELDFAIKAAKEVLKTPKDQKINFNKKLLE